MRSPRRAVRSAGARTGLLAALVCLAGGCDWLQPQSAEPAEQPQLGRPPVGEPALQEPTPPEDTAEARRWLAKGRQQTRRRELARAARSFERACELGSAAGCLALAKQLERGRGVKADPDRAGALMDEACAAGLEEACDLLGH